MSTKRVTLAHRLHNARQLVESLVEPSNTAYYAFLGRHLPYDDESDIPEIPETVGATVVEAYRNMMMGKRVANTDVVLMVRNIAYESNRVFDMYDDANTEIMDGDFFAIVNSGSFHHVWKCLDNNNGANSTVEPDIDDVDPEDLSYRTNDGYMWKYLFSTTNANRLKFATSTHFPIAANTDVVDAAIDGSIDVIRVEDGGRGYDNWTRGTFSVSDLRVNGNNLLYALSNTSGVSSNDYYNGCLMYLSGGTGSGQYRTVSDYVVNGSGKFMVVNGAFDTDPTALTTFEVYPQVFLWGDGAQSDNAVARALVNSVGNTVYRVEVLNRGAGYSFHTANVYYSNSVTPSVAANVRSIYSPPGGHGFDPPAELGARHVCISVEFSNNEGNTIPTTNDFRQVGLLKDPLFGNVVINAANQVGTFFNGEQVHKVEPLRLALNATMNTTSNLVSSALGDFTSQLASQDYVYLASNDETSYQLGIVSSVVNSTHFRLTTNGFFACTETGVFLARPTSNGIVHSTVDTLTTIISNVAGIISSDDRLIGLTSGATVVVDSVERSGKEKGFNTFVQLYKYAVDVPTGTFQNDEPIRKVDPVSETTSWAALHSLVNESGQRYVYASNQVGRFTTANTTQLVGNTSGATTLITDVHHPELVQGSGEVLYLENIPAVTRSGTQKEAIRYVLEF